MTTATKVYTFIDNSNVWIEGKRAARIHFDYQPDQLFRLRISYGNLLDVIRGNRPLGGTVLAGSRPPANDKLWARLKAMGIEPRIYDRSVRTGEEKVVDAEIVNAIRDVLEENAEPGIIALVAGDGDYLSTLERCVKRGWKVEVYFWSLATASTLKRLPGAKFIELDQFLPQISFLAPEKPFGGASTVAENVAEGAPEMQETA